MLINPFNTPKNHLKLVSIMRETNGNLSLCRHMHVSNSDSNVSMILK